MPQPPPRPFLETETLDALARQNTELLSELWILRDRLSVLEKMLDDKGVVSRQALDDYVPTGDFAAELDRERGDLVRRVIGAPWNQDYTVESLIQNRGR